MLYITEYWNVKPCDTKIAALFNERQNLEKKRIVFPPHFMYDFPRKMFPMSCHILLTGQISLSDCFHFVIYWAISVLQFFVSQVVTP